MPAATFSLILLLATVVYGYVGPSAVRVRCAMLQGAACRRVASCADYGAVGRGVLRRFYQGQGCVYEAAQLWGLASVGDISGEGRMCDCAVRVGVR